MNKIIISSIILGIFALGFILGFSIKPTEINNERLPLYSGTGQMVIFLEDVSKGDYIDFVGAEGNKIIAEKTNDRDKVDGVAYKDYNVGDYGEVITERTYKFANSMGDGK